MTPLDFEAKRDADSDSWRRADPDAALIERIAWDTWIVTLPDSDTTYEVSLHRRYGALTGDCHVRASGEQCPARKYSDPEEPCAHLCTIQKGTVIPDRADDGTTIQIFDRDDAEIAAADALDTDDVDVGAEFDRLESATAEGGADR